MKEVNNLKLKILSLVLAFFVWLTVMNLSNPQIESKCVVTLETVNGNVLTDANRHFEISSGKTVNVYFTVRAMNEQKIKPSDFRAYVDLADLYDVTGAVQVKVEVLNHKEMIDSPEARPGVVRVNTEELQTKVFDLAVEPKGEAADGYAWNGAALVPSSITVQGPISKVGLISYAGVEVDISEASSNVTGTEKPILYDANGNELNISGVEVNTNEVQYEMVINKVKELPLDFAVSGRVASGYRFTGIECSTKNISVLGLKSNLAEINKITIPGSSLNLDGATSDRMITVDIREFLPEGVELAESVSPEIDVLLKVEQLVDRTVSLASRDVAFENASDRYSYRFIPSRVEVVVKGLADDLEQLDGGDLGASIDVAGMEVGPHTGVLSFLNSSVFDVVSVTEFQIDVVNKVGIAGEKMPESATESEGDSETEQTNENLITEPGQS